MKLARGIIVNAGNEWIEIRGKGMTEITLISRNRI